MFHMNTRTAFTLAGSMTVATAFGLLNEATGYNMFNTTSGFNLACAVDPTCRSLTEDERTLAFGFFGHTVDYDKLKIFSRRDFFNAIADRQYAMSTVQSTIHTGARYETTLSKPAVFIHEMAHVWQNQTGFPSTDRYENPEDRYEYTIIEDVPFWHYGTEQQAEILYDLYLRYEEFETIPMMYREEFCMQSITPLEGAIGNIIPLPASPCRGHSSKPSAPTR
jgi:hypothetical protein